MLIRNALKDDVSIIAEMIVETQKSHVEAYPKRFLPISLEDAKLLIIEQLGSIGVIVAEIEGCIVGYAIFNIVITEQTKIRCSQKFCYLQQIGVNAQNRNSGIGYELIQFVKSECLEQNIDDIELDVWAFNEQGQSFFKKVGFEAYGFKMKALNNKSLNAGV